MLPDGVSRRVYFWIQRTRGSVTPDLIDSARRLLNADQGARESFVCGGLRRVHGAPTPPWEWLQERPLSERHEVAQRWKNASMNMGRRVEWKRTSGSTGTPVSLPRDMEFAAWSDATMWAVLGWHGIRPGDRHVRFWGTRNRAHPALAGLRNALLNRIPVNAFALSPHSVQEHMEHMRRARPKYVYGYPTAISHFVDGCIDQGLYGADLGIATAVTTGELLTPVVREKISTFFSARVVNEYGCSESGILAFECESGTMHRLSTTAHLEVVDEGGRRRPDGEEGEVVITDLVGHTFPLLRYRLHDRAAVRRGSACGCGRTLPMLEVDRGRSGSFVRFPDGGRVYSAFLAYSMPAGVRRFVAIQNSVHELVVRVALDSDSGWPKVERELERNLRTRIPSGVRLVFEAVPLSELPVEGKHRYFVPMDRENEQPR